LWLLNTSQNIFRRGRGANVKTRLTEI